MHHHRFAVAFWLCTVCLTPEAGWAQHAKHVIYVDALAGENIACIVPADHVGPCPSEAAPDAFMDSLHAVEMKVVNRRFLSDYDVEIRGSTTVLQPRIRALEDAATLSLGAGSLIEPPPAKGAAPALTAKTASEVFGDLVNESNVDRPSAALAADVAEVVREHDALRLRLSSFNSQLTAFLGPVQSAEDCSPNAGAPTLHRVRDCLQREVDANPLSAAALGSAPSPASIASPIVTDENRFRALVIRVNDDLAQVRNLQRLLSQAQLPSVAASLDADVAQFEKNYATLTANIRAAAYALRLFDALNRMPGNRTRRDLRSDQLRAYLRSQLKELAGDETTPALTDEAELNALVNSYVAFLVSGGFRTADAEVQEFSGRVTGWERSTRGLDPASVRNDLSQAQHQLHFDVVGEVAELNAVQSTLVGRVNRIYDLSHVPEPLLKVVDLSKYSGNTFGYAVRRTDSFTRYSIENPTLASAAPTTATATSGGTIDAGPPAGASQTPPSGQVVANGSFEVHQFDRGAVIAGFLFAAAKNDEGKRIAESHIMLGIEYYLRGRDTFPGASGRHIAYGVVGGVSLNALNNYFVGLAVEPTLGFNFSAGARLAKDARQTVSPYAMVGFDVDIFRKVFGKVTGVGTAAASIRTR